MIDKTDRRMINRTSEQIAHSLHRKCVENPGRPWRETIENPGGARPEEIVQILGSLLEEYDVKASFNEARTQIRIKVQPSP